MNILTSPEEAAKRLRNGEVGIIATDTVYGIVGLASLPAAVQRVYDLKDRVNKPGIVIAANVGQLIELGVAPRYLKAVEHFWPNPISVELPVSDNLKTLHNGRHVTAFRIPNVETLRQFLETTGPLITTSANHPHQPTASTVEEAAAYFGDQVDFYLDGGALTDKPPSTVIRIVDDAVEVIREGAVKINEFGEIES